MENQDIPRTLDNYYILNNDNSKSAAYTLNELTILKINEMITSDTLIIRNGEDPKPAGTFLDSYNPNVLSSLETEDSEMLPEELNTFNLGAYILAPLWGYSHLPKYRAYGGGFIILLCLSFLSLIYLSENPLYPYLQVIFFGSCVLLYIISIIFLIQGNNLAWNNRKFESTDQFKNIQRKWLKWGCIIFVIYSSLFMLLFYISHSKIQ